MLLSNKRGDRTIPIIIRNAELQQKDDCKFLGIYIDKELNWKAHIKYIANKVSKNVALLGRLKHTFPKPILKKSIFNLDSALFKLLQYNMGSGCHHSP